jgi:hypothetical protein
MRIEDGNPLTVSTARKEPHIFKIRLKIKIATKNPNSLIRTIFGIFGIFWDFWDFWDFLGD